MRQQRGNHGSGQTGAVYLAMVSVLVQRQRIFCEERRQISGVNDEEYRPEDRSSCHIADDVSEGRTFCHRSGRAVFDGGLATPLGDPEPEFGGHTVTKKREHNTGIGYGFKAPRGSRGTALMVSGSLKAIFAFSKPDESASLS